VREAVRIAGQLRRSLFHEGWHGPAVFEVLHDLDAERAARITPLSRHSIWAIVHHLRVWHEQALEAISAKPLPPFESAIKIGWEPSDPPQFQSNAERDHAWTQELRRFKNAGEQLSQRAATMDDRKLQSQVPGRAYDIAHLLLGVASHNTYHCGQLVLLHRYVYIYSDPPPDQT
jgi:uncharacterized damage-inducible protein DinB